MTAIYRGLIFITGIAIRGLVTRGFSARVNVTHTRYSVRTRAEKYLVH